MRNKIIRKRNLSQPEILPDFYNLAKNDEERFFYKLISSIKDNKRKPNNVRLRNIINNDYKSNTINNKTLIKKHLESNINLSKEYNNFCGSFLFPDYSFASGKKILRDLKSIGVEKTINKHFIRKIPKANYIKKSNVYSITNKKSNSVIKSKYLDLIQNNNNNHLINNNSLMNKKNKKYHNSIKYNDYYNQIVPDRKKRIIIFEYNDKKDNKNKKKIIEKPINSTIINRNSFCKQNTNNSQSYISSSTSCKSKKIRNMKMKFKI